LRKGIDFAVRASVIFTKRLWPPAEFTGFESLNHMNLFIRTDDVNFE